MALKNLATVYSAELEGVEAKLIEVEIDLNVGIHAFNIVGLADKALNEAKERVNSALKNSGANPPNRQNRKITINLAPADVKKAGSQYDLAIALGYLLATKQMQRFESEDKIFLGELALDGRLRPINGALNVAQMAGERGFKYLFVPTENANEAAAIKAMRIIPVESLREAIDILETKRPLLATHFEAKNSASDKANGAERASGASGIPDFSEIIGQEHAKRALTIAASGLHNILLTGPPGVGKSFLARALGGILPELELDEAIEITKIWSAAGLRPGGLIRERPFRAPHQTASSTAIVGGGPDPKPGEISLAHRGILFLDEMPEFQKGVLEALRQPMESGSITISRTKGTLVFPAKFTLVAAMNPCPCGYYGDPEKACKCSAYEVIKYQKRISGPLLDRIDLQIKVGRVKMGDLRNEKQGELKNEILKEEVERARAAQRKRFNSNSSRSNGLAVSKTNSEMTSRETDRFVRFEPAAERLLRTLDKSNISPRGYYRLLKVARTIADLAEAELVSAEHLAEAFSYRLRQEP